MNLKTEQQRLYALMPVDVRCFVRVSDKDNALWISDLPRRLADCTEVQNRLKQEGFTAWLDTETMLWYLDWTREYWQEKIAGLSPELPSLPVKEEYHEAYALCRLYLLHPSELETEHLPAVRKAIKLTAMQPGQRLRAVHLLHEEAANRLREGKSIAHAAGLVLAAWLNESVNRKETQP